MAPSLCIPRSVFVSHAAQDSSFAHLLLKVLGLHGLHAWHDPDDTAREDGTPTVLDKGLCETESLVVVLSPAALESDAVRQQLRSFRPGAGQGRVVAVLLHPIAEQHALLQDLEGAAVVDCTANKLLGLRDLMAALGESFLPGTVTPRSLRESQAPSLEQRLVRAVEKLSERNPLIQPKQPLRPDLRQWLLMEIIEAFEAPLKRKFQLINPVNGEPTTLPLGVLEELILDSRNVSHGLETCVPEFFARAVASRLEEAFRIEPGRRARARSDVTTLAAPPSVQPAQEAALRKFSKLASRINATPVAV